MPSTYSPMVGTEVIITVKFYNPNGALADPITTHTRVKMPSGKFLEPSPLLVKSSTGIYTTSFIVTQPGRWTIQAKGQGNITVVDETYFNVRPEFNLGKSTFNS